MTDGTPDVGLSERLAAVANRWAATPNTQINEHNYAVGAMHACAAEVLAALRAEPDAGLDRLAAVVDVLTTHHGFTVRDDVYQCVCGTAFDAHRGYRAHVATEVLATVEAAHARDLAALRERAEVAEAKVAAVEAQEIAWRVDGADRAARNRDSLTGKWLLGAAEALRAALADRPAGGEG